MTPSGDYRAWLVDLDGTLYRQSPVRVAMAFELLLCAPHRIPAIRRFRREQEHIRRETPPSSVTCAYRHQLERTAESLGCGTDTLAPLIRYWMEERPLKWLRLFARSSFLQEITEHRRTGGKTALVSDYPATRKLQGLGVAHLFDIVLASGEPGGPTSLKPSPEGYLLAAERLGVLPGHCLVVGDRDDADGEAARRAGMSFRLVK